MQVFSKFMAVCRMAGWAVWLSWLAELTDERGMRTKEEGEEERKEEKEERRRKKKQEERGRKGAERRKQGGSGHALPVSFVCHLQFWLRPLVTAYDWWFVAADYAYCCSFDSDSNHEGCLLL